MDAPVAARTRSKKNFEDPPPCTPLKHSTRQQQQGPTSKEPQTGLEVTTTAGPDTVSASCETLTFPKRDYPLVIDSALDIQSHSTCVSYPTDYGSASSH